jgi:opacity protein-like surface antigen
VGAADGLYLGAEAGVLERDVAGFDNAVNAGIRIGYEFQNIGIGDLAIEGSYIDSVSDGDLPAGGEWSMKAFSGFVVLRTAGPIYLKGRAGFSAWDVDAGAASADGTDFSYGLGAGLSFGVAQLEIEYTVLEDDLKYYGAALNIMTPF